MFGGMVIHGDGRGRPLGYPTANLDCREHEVRLTPGVYAAWTYVGKKKYSSALALSGNPWKVEVHLLDFPDTNLYGQYLHVDPISKVGPMVAFRRLSELKKKIYRDIEIIRHVFDHL